MAQLASVAVSADRVYLVDVLKSLSFSSLAEHPSKWFEKNPGMKPPVELPAVYCTLEAARSTMKCFLLNKPSSRLSSDLVLLYLRKLARDMQALLEEDWTSFGITIGKAGSEVGPLDIVNVKNRAACKLKLNPTVTAGPEDDLWILMALTAGFYHSVTTAGHGECFKAPPEVLEHWKKVGFEPGLFWENNYSLANDFSYRIMIAVFDMFLVRFPNHKFNPARKLTGVSRFQGCAAYESLIRLSELIKKDFREIQKWLWGSQLQNEFLKITLPGNEMNQAYSYAPYFMSLQLAHISPYTENEHPNLYTFCNIVRATLNDREARCARMPVEAIFPNVPVNAFLFAYTLVPGEEKRHLYLPYKTDFEECFAWFLEHRSSCALISMYSDRPRSLCYKLHHHSWSTFGQDPPGSIGRMLYGVRYC